MPSKKKPCQRAYQAAYYQRVTKPRKLNKTGGRSGVCCYCGDHSEALTIEHLVAKSKGGDDSSENTKLACSWCNSSKGRRPLEEWRLSLARRIAGIPTFTIQQREWLQNRFGLLVYEPPAKVVAGIVFAFEGEPTGWKRRVRS